MYNPFTAPIESMIIQRFWHAIYPKIRNALYNTSGQVEDFSCFLNQVISAKSSVEMQAFAKNYINNKPCWCRFQSQLRGYLQRRFICGKRNQKSNFEREKFNKKHLYQYLMQQKLQKRL